jgi:hypothetical protein
MSSTLTVTPRAHWMNTLIVRPLSTPYISVDGTARRAAWNRPLTVPVDEGTHQVAVGIRYFDRGTSLGEEPLEVNVQDDDTDQYFEARNGPLNHQPFALTPVQPS